uniref:Uncharacterized protein n=1 Tax=Prevotella sp. GTC17262 TaxID=3236797 RepID=A0AB33JFM4_9BACT
MVNFTCPNYFLKLKDCKRDFRIESFVAAGQRYFQVCWLTGEPDEEHEMYFLFSDFHSVLDFITHNLDLKYV